MIVITCKAAFVELWYKSNIKPNVVLFFLNDHNVSLLCPRAWLREMLSLVQGEALNIESVDLEQLIKKHAEYRLQIDRQLSKSKGVKADGRRLLLEGIVMSREVNTKSGIIYFSFYIAHCTV